MAVEILSNDQISRCILYARAFDGEVHTDENLWPFGKSGDDGAAHESAVLRRVAPTDNDVHRIGCKIAAGQNVKRGDPLPGPQRRYYCGFRTATVADLPLEGDGYYVVVTNVPEDDEESHVDVSLFITVEGRNARANKRTDAGIALAEVFGSAVPFICHCDQDDEHHPINKYGAQCLTTYSTDAALPPSYAQ